MKGGHRKLSPWCNSIGKRTFDLMLGVVVLVLASPALALVAILVKLTSAGPVFFRQSRPGRNGEVFQIVKFRTMRHQPHAGGPVLTRTGDDRVTPVGRILRKWKLDELPQLVNVLNGRMSFVGPRPQPAKLWSHFGELPVVLMVRPGITGPATLAFRHEEQLLQHLKPADVEREYIQHLMPAKMCIDERYLQSASLRTDVICLINTVFRVFDAPDSSMGDVSFSPIGARALRVPSAEPSHHRHEEGLPHPLGLSAESAINTDFVN